MTFLFGFACGMAGGIALTVLLVIACDAPMLWINSDYEDEDAKRP